MLWTSHATTETLKWEFSDWKWCFSSNNFAFIFFSRCFKMLHVAVKFLSHAILTLRFFSSFWAWDMRQVERLLGVHIQPKVWGLSETSSSENSSLNLYRNIELNHSRKKVKTLVRRKFQLKFKFCDFWHSSSSLPNNNHQTFTKERVQCRQKIRHAFVWVEFEYRSSKKKKNVERKNHEHQKFRLRKIEKSLQKKSVKWGFLYSFFAKFLIDTLNELP